MKEEAWIKLMKEIEENPEFYELGKLMEEMAGAPKEELGKRQPEEKGMYECYNASRKP